MPREENTNLPMKKKIINTYVKAISVTQKITRLKFCSCFPGVVLTHVFGVGLNKRRTAKH